MADAPPQSPTAAPIADAVQESLAPSLASSHSPWRALKSHNYRLYFGGMLLSQIGNWMQRVALAWLVLDLTGSSVALATVAILEFAPALLFGLFAGVAADRWPRRSLLGTLAVLQILQAGALAAMVFADHVSLWLVYGLALLGGALNTFDEPVRKALAGETVARQDIPSAIGLNSTLFNTARIVGPALGGIIIATAGSGWCFLLNALSFGGVLLMVLWLKTSGSPLQQGAPGTRVLTQVMEGLRYARREPVLMLPLLVHAFLGTFGYNFGVTLPLLARYEFGTGPEGFGAMHTAMGVGALLGALLAAGCREVGPQIVLIGALGFSLRLFGVALAPVYAVVLGALGLLGVCTVTYTASANTLIQLHSLPEYRGRVLSMWMLLNAGMTPLGAALTGTLADIIGIRATLAGEAALCLCGTLLGGYYFFRPRQ